MSTEHADGHTHERFPLPVDDDETQAEQSGPTAAGTAQGERVDTAAILAQHRECDLPAHRQEGGVGHCTSWADAEDCDGLVWPCTPARLAIENQALKAQLADTEDRANAWQMSFEEKRELAAEEIEALRGQVAEARADYESAEQEINAIATLCAESGVSMDDTHQVVEKVARVTAGLESTQKALRFAGRQMHPFTYEDRHGQVRCLCNAKIEDDYETQHSDDCEFSQALANMGQVIQRNPNASASPARMPSGQRGGAGL